MKVKFLILLLLLSVFLFAETHEAKDEADEYMHFNNYRDEQTNANYFKAVEHYTEQLRSDATDYNANMMLSYLHLMELNKNLDVLETNLDSLMNRTKFSYANLLLDLGQSEESVKIYNQITDATPNWSCPWRHKGEALLKTKDFEEAEKATLMAIETRENHFDAYTQLAEIQIQMGKSKIALETFNKGLEFYSSDTEEEIADIDVKFLQMKLWKLNKMTENETYKKFIKELKEEAPDDERLK
jgi:tetratricopeptide (TPR) repeat protein